MTDRRRYTGTKTLQTGWSLLLVVSVLVVLVVLPDTASPGLLLGAGAVWILGLFGLGLRERRRWSQLTAATSFDSVPGAKTADLQQIRHGQTVSVTTDVPGLLAQTRTVVRGTVEGVDASFTVRIVDAETAPTDRTSVETGDEELDERFHVEGKPENVETLLSERVRTVLRSVEAPGTVKVTGDEVVYRIPFTRLRPDELDAASEVVAVLAARVEAVGKG